MKNTYDYTYVHGGIVLHLTRAQAIKVLRDAKEEEYTCTLDYTHYWLDRTLRYAGSSGGFFFRRKDGKHFMLYRDAGVFF